MTNEPEISATIIHVIHCVAEESGKELVEGFGKQTVLLESGLDSLDFAIIVARLERELGYDPFLQLDEPVYPRTLSDLIGVYARAKASVSE